MASKVPIRRIYFQDVIDEEGNVNAEKLLYPVNTFMESVYQLFEGNIEFGVNIKSQTKTLTFTTESDYTSAQNFVPIKFINSLNTVVTGVTMLRIFKTQDIEAVITSAVSIQWSPKQNDVSLNYVSGLADSTQYTIVLFIL